MTKKRARKKSPAKKPATEAGTARRPARRSAAAKSALAVDVRCDVRALRSVAPLLARVARHVASAERFESSALSVVVVDGRTMARLHGEYMNDPTPTDVLTFDLGTSIDRRRLEGEIVVCADVALEHAGRRGVRRELALYVAHGVLHLAGYDDHTPRGYARMHAREDALLEGLGLGRPFERGASG